MPRMTAGHGRRWITRLHRYDSVSRSGFGSRSSTRLRNGGTARLARSTMMAIGTITAKSTGMPRPTPIRPTATRPAAIRPRRRVTSIRSPAKPRSAGSNVSEAISVMATTVAMPMAMPEMKLSCMMSRPIREMTTVVPANSTARPAVSIATRVEDSTLWPLWRFSRNRVTMNSA